MKMLSKKGALLIAAASAVCALAMPSMAPASSWGTTGTTHTLTSSNLGYSAHSPLIGQLQWTCLSSQFHVDVASAAALRVTGVSFRSCSTVGGLPDASRCTITPTVTGLPWTITAPTTTNIQIEGLFIDLRFETIPGGGFPNCAIHNQSLTFTGTVSGAFWEAGQHQMHFPPGTGASLHSLFGSATPAPATVFGTLRDTTQSLTLT